MSDLEIILPTQAIYISGKWEASLQLYQGNRKLSTYTWEYEVLPSIDQSNTIVTGKLPATIKDLMLL